MQETQSAMFSFKFKNSSNHEVRTVLKEDGSIWFVAKDVCKVLKLSSVTMAVKNLEKDELTSIKFRSAHQGRKMNIISESGLYALVLRSNKPEARAFRKWVTSEVLPQIRKTGAYVPAQPQVSADTLRHTATPKAVVSFLQVSTDTFWYVHKALNEHRIIEGELKRAKKAISAIIDSIKEVFPDAREILEVAENESDSRAMSRHPLRVEMHKR